MRAAIYARVSTDRQDRDQTIDGQLTALRQWATEQGHELRPEHVFTDEGYSGARLGRPGLVAEVLDKAGWRHGRDPQRARPDRVQARDRAESVGRKR
jgi:hypothetical protein